MSFDTSMFYFGSIRARLDALQESIREQRRQAIRGTIYLLITDPFDREDAIQHCHENGLMFTPVETFQRDLIAAIEPYLPKDVANAS